MPILKLNIESNKNRVPLPTWITFAFKLGKYLYHSKESNLNILISTPSSAYINLFVALGIVNEEFKNGISEKNNLKNYQSLKKNDRLILIENGNQSKVSFLEFFEDKEIKYIKICIDEKSKCTQSIPEKSWEQKLIILDESGDRTYRKTKVHHNFDEEFNEESILWKLYDKNTIENLYHDYSDLFYLIGNKKLIECEMKELCLIYGYKLYNLEEFLFIKNLDNRSNYLFKNGAFYSSQKRNFENTINADLPVIFSNLTGYSHQKKYFKKNTKLIIMSRSTNEILMTEFLTGLDNMFIEGDIQFCTKEFIRKIPLSKNEIPNGIELLVWRN